jgi:hypothetical protein
LLLFFFFFAERSDGIGIPAVAVLSLRC